MLRFDNLASALPAPAQMLEAQLWLYETAQTNASVAKNLSVHRVSADWTNSATWVKRTATQNWTTPGGDYDAAAEDTIAVKPAGNWMNWTITDLASGWMDSTILNQGVAVTDDGNHADNGVTFASADYANSTVWPEVEVFWYPRTGELPGYTLDAQRLSDRSSAKVNVANGNLLIDSADLHIAGRGLDQDIHRYFNSLDPYDGKLGWGWRLNVSEDVILHDCDNNSRCLIGPSGYQARFRRRADGSYITPPGVPKTLVHNGDGTWSLTDHRSGEEWHFFNNAYTFQTWAKDRHGNQITYQTNPSYGLDGISDTRSRLSTVSNNSYGDATGVQDSTGRQWTYAYAGGADRMLTSATNPDNQATSYSYDTQYRLQTITDARGSATTIGYDTNNRVHTIVRQIDNTRAHDLTTTYDYGTAAATCNRTGEIGNTVITDPRGKTTTYCWNREGRVLRTLDGAGYEQSTLYTPNGDANSFTDLTGSAAATGTLSFDTTGSDPTNNLQGGTGAAGEHFSVGYCDPAAVSGPTQCSTYAQHAYQPISVTGPDHNRYLAYNATGDLTSVKDSTTSPTNQATLTYATDGTVATAKDGNNNQTTFGYDSGGQLTTITPPTITGTNALGTTAYTYDALSRVITVKDGRHATGTYEISAVTYDGEDRVTKLTFGNGSWTTYGYDQNGNLTSRADSAGNSTTYVYDRSNRRTSETFPGYSNTYAYDTAGNLASVSDASGAVSYGYDDANRVNLITQPDSTQITVAYSGPTIRPRWTKLTYPGGINQTTTSDDSGKPISIVVKTSGATTLRSLTYTYSTSPTARSQIQTVTDQAGNITTYTYDPVGRLTQAEAKTSAAVLIDRWTYTYDNASNRTKLVRAGSSTSTTTYGYNPDNVLCWSYNGTSTNACASPPAGASTYTSDASGNQTAGPSSFTATYDVANRMTAFPGGALSYLSPTTTELVAIGSTTLRNNLLGLSAQTTAGATTSYTRTPDGTLLAQRTSTGTQYVLNDTLTSTRGLFTNTSSSIDRTYTYDPDGNSTNSGSGATTTLKYAGGLDIGSGLYHYGQRYYAPAQGRWTQPDPISSVDSLQEANQFVYAGGDPADFTDLAGTCIVLSCKTWKQAGGIAFAAGGAAVAGGSYVATAACVAGTIEEVGPESAHCLYIAAKGGTVGTLMFATGESIYRRAK